MDFLSIRKKARERSEAKAGAAAPHAQAGPPGEEEATATTEPARERRRQERRASQAAPPSGRPEEDVRAPGDEPVLTESDVAEGALQARMQGLEPSADPRFATWRPGSSPPPMEPDVRGLATTEAPFAFEEPAPTPPVIPEPPPLPRAPRVEAPRDPLDEFFFRPDEETAFVPLLGSPLAEEPAPPAPTAIDEFLTFQLDKEEFAIPIGRVREVLKAPAITEVPRAPAHVVGVVTVRGEVVAILDARARLGLAASTGGQVRIVIVDTGHGTLGLLVDQVSSVVRLPRGSIEPCPQGICSSASDCVTGIGRWRDRLFMVVDVEALLGGPRPAEAR